MRCTIASTLVAALQSARIRQTEHGAPFGILNDTSPSVQGCTCKTACKPGSLGLTGCDECRTEEDCGNFGLIDGRWDVCDYPPVQEFEKMSYTYKMNYYTEKILAVPYTTKDETEISPLPIFRQSMAASFDNFLPEMPKGRNKNIHAIGSVGIISLLVDDTSKYTGLLGPGESIGFARFGSATAVSGGIVPGTGWKFPRTGVHSGDMVAMASITGGQSFNFFKPNITNHVPPPEGMKRLLSKKFETATICATQIGLSDMAAYDQDGNKIASPHFPFKLFYIPSRSIQLGEQNKTLKDVADELASIEEGTILYDVWACDEPTDHESEPSVTLERHCAGRTHFGSVRLNSRFTGSDYGDRHFHIRHQRIEEDWKVRPEHKIVGQEACGRSDGDWGKGSPKSCESTYRGMLSSES